MNRRAVGVVLAGFLSGGAAIAGCNFIVDAGDYAVAPDAGVILRAEAGTKPDGGGDGQGGKDGTADARGGLIGDPCSDNSECTRVTCGGEWCTEPCLSNAACGSNSRGEMNFCVQNGNGEFVCVPGCADKADCLPYEGTTCAQISGGTAFVCTTVTSAGDGGLADEEGGGGIVGDPCSDDGGTGCSVGTCNGSWCWTSCTSPTDTSCESNTLGELNYCALAASNLYMCFPGCSTNADCTPFANTTCSPNEQGTPSDGFSCSTPFGQIGDPCADSQGCIPDAGATTCVESWCSAPCTSPTDTSCGSSSTGQANYCVKTTGATGYTCSPGCTTSDDCTPYPQTFCQPIAKGATGLICAPSGGLIGDPCSEDSDCSQGTCMGNWCDEVCAKAGSTECGTDTAGMANQCVLAMDSQNHCFPGCTTNSDCAPYPNTTCEPVTGGSVCSD
jgi:hypothetical protein